MEEISKHVKKGTHGVVVFDQATWHTSKKLKIPTNLSLLPFQLGFDKLGVGESW